MPQPVVHRAGVPHEQDRPENTSDLSSAAQPNRRSHLHLLHSLYHHARTGKEAQEGKGTILAQSGKRVDQEYLLHHLHAARDNAGTDHRVEDVKRPAVARRNRQILIGVSRCGKQATSTTS